MQFADRRIESNDKELPVKRTKDRIQWAKIAEEKVRDLCPYPTSYDVDSTQDTDFSEFSYTEFLNGIMMKTQSIDINTRIMDLASKEENDYLAIRHIEDIQDKYVQNVPQIDMKYPEHVCFFVGHNMFDMMDRNIIGRYAFENNGNFAVKLHPLTNEEYAKKVSKIVGWNQILPQQISGDFVLRQCKTAYVTSATEMATKAVIYGKEIVNVSNFYAEAIGCYFALNRVYFEAIKNGENPLIKLNNIINCKWSGVILPWMDDYEDRIKAFYEKALELREIYKPLYQKPTQNIKQPNK